jgi:hypothetical protein
VEDQFAKFEAACGDGRKKALAGQICMELTLHTKIQEEKKRVEGIFSQARKVGFDRDGLGRGDGC